MPFAETALFRHSFSNHGTGPKGMKFAKTDLRMEKGLFVGRKSDSNEYLFATPKGTFTTRTAKRLPVDGRSDLKLFGEVIGTPWNRQCELPRGRKAVLEKQVRVVPLSVPVSPHRG